MVLLHGFPASSFMFRDLIPRLADRYHVIAPDHLGFGLSDAPPADEFGYTFDALAGLTAGLLGQLGDRPVCHVRPGLRGAGGLAAGPGRPGRDHGDHHPERQRLRGRLHRGLLEAGAGVLARTATRETEAAVRQALTLDVIRWQYLHGVPDESLVSPDTWQHDFAQVSRPGNDLVQLALFADYASNLPLYPRLHAYLRDSHVPVLAVWGRNDPIFGPDGALAFAGTRPARRSTSWTAATSCSKATSTPSADSIRGFLGRTLS